MQKTCPLRSTLREDYPCAINCGFYDEVKKQCGLYSIVEGVTHLVELTRLLTTEMRKGK